jgi:copper transport protein
MLLAAATALAHTELKESAPADESALETPPKEVMLHFSAAVRLTALTVTKRDEAAVDLSPLPTGSTERFTVSVPDLAAGAYTVDWRALAGDGHVLRGAFTFTVGTPSSHAEHSQGH